MTGPGEVSPVNGGNAEGKGGPSPSRSEGDAASEAKPQGVPGEGPGGTPLSPSERGASERSDASGVCPGRTGGGNTPNDQQQNPANPYNPSNLRFRQPELTTINNTPPIGICGSGLIDLLAELRRHDIMNELGNFNDGSDEFTFHHENRLTLSRADISALAQAKAANYCGQNIVLETTKTTPYRLHPPLPSRRLRQLHQHPKRHKHRLHPRHPTRPHNQNRQRLPPRRHNNANQRHQTGHHRRLGNTHHPHRTRNQPQLLRPLRRRLPIQEVKPLSPNMSRITRTSSKPFFSSKLLQFMITKPR